MISPLYPPAVTLNLFQGPFLRNRGRWVYGRKPGGLVCIAATVEAARWMLNRVQHDDLVEGTLI